MIRPEHFCQFIYDHTYEMQRPVDNPYNLRLQQPYLMCKVQYFVNDRSSESWLSRMQCSFIHEATLLGAVFTAFGRTEEIRDYYRSISCARGYLRYNKKQYAAFNSSRDRCRFMEGLLN